VHVPSFSPETLISGGGDPALKIWDWMVGRVKFEVEVWSRVQSFVKVKSGRKGRGWGEEPGAGRRRKRRNKAKGYQSNEGEGEDDDIEELSEEASPGTANLTLDEPPVTTADPEEIIQVVHKIDSFDSGTGRYILFNAVGFVASHFFSPSELTFNFVAQPQYLYFPSLP
jgi:tRNA (guanine-N(7)-)-methyltransferase subunit TRM82